MTQAAVIQGQLVDARNVNTHKCFRLIIDIPAELAEHAIKVFGWPTQVNPVSVAIARLQTGKDGEANTERMGSNQNAQSEPGRNNTQPRQLDDKPTGGAKKSPGQIAGYFCTLRGFWMFLEYHELLMNDKILHIENEDQAAEHVREICGVSSRSQITESNTAWSSLMNRYRVWQLEPSVVP